LQFILVIVLQVPLHVLQLIPLRRQPNSEQSIEDDFRSTEYFIDEFLGSIFLSLNFLQVRVRAVSVFKWFTSVVSIVIFKTASTMFVVYLSSIVLAERRKRRQSKNQHRCSTSVSKGDESMSKNKYIHSTLQPCI
jgi:hypothetical protein